MACCLFRFGDCHCFLAAALFVLGSILRFGENVVIMRDMFIWEIEDKTYYNDLQPLQLASIWTARFETEHLVTASILVLSCAWICLAIVLIKLAWSLSEKGTVAIGSNATIVVLALAGTFAEVLGGLFFLGANKAMLNIVETYELNNWITLGGDGFDQNNVTQFRRILDDKNETSNDDAAEKARQAEMGNRGNQTDDTDAINDDGQGQEDDTPFPASQDDFYDEQEDLGDYGDTFNDYVDAGEEQNNFDFESIRDNPNDDEFQIDGDFSNSDYNEDGLGWKSLELAYATSKGMVQLVDSVEFVTLAAIMITLFGLVRRRSGSFSKAWSYLGLVMSFVAFIQFCLAMSSYDTWDDKYRTTVVLMFINQVILLPIWLIWLGLQMKDVAESGVDANPSIATMKEAETDNDTEDYPSSFN